MKSINLIAYKTESGIWAFDHEHQNTKNEALCNGTELVLDWYYKMLSKTDPKPMDKMDIVASTEKFGDMITTLYQQSTTDSGTTYKDSLLGKDVWLCPWLQSYFGIKPDKLYVGFELAAEENHDEDYRWLSEFTDAELEDWINSCPTIIQD